MKRCKKMLIAPLMFSTVFLGIMAANASETALGSDFSQVVNVNNSGTYSTPIYLQVLRIAKEFNVASEFQSAYGETVSTSRSSSIFKNRNDYGFKINGQFYNDGISLTDNGTYHIEGYNCKINSDGVTVPTTKIESEDFTITIDVGKEINLNKDTFYYQNYDYAEEFVKDVISSFSEEVTLGNISINNMLKAYNSFSESDTEAKVISISASESIKEYTIYLKSFNSSDVKMLDIDELTKNIDPVVVNTAKYDDYLDKDITSISDLQNELYLNLDVPEPHVLDIEITSSPKLISNNKGSLSEVKYIIYEIYDKTMKKTYNYSRPFYTVNTNKFIDDEKPVIEFKENIKLNLHQTPDINDIVDNVYDMVLGKKSYSNISKFTYDLSQIDTSKTGFYKVKVSASDYKNSNVETTQITVEVVSDNAPIVLQKYNHIYIDKDKRTYNDLIMVIDDVDSTSDMIIETSLVETSNYGGYIDVKATDTNGHTTTAKIEFTWEKKVTFYKKCVEYPLYKLKKLFADMFN